MFGSEHVGNTSVFQRQPLIDPYTSRQAHRAERDAVKIFDILYDIKRNNLEKEKEAYDELTQQAEMDYYYWDRKTPANERYSVSLERRSDKSYFIENLYRTT